MKANEVRKMSSEELEKDVYKRQLQRYAAARLARADRGAQSKSGRTRKPVTCVSGRVKSAASGRIEPCALTNNLKQEEIE